MKWTVFSSLILFSKHNPLPLYQIIVFRDGSREKGASASCIGFYPEWLWNVCPAQNFFSFWGLCLYCHSSVLRSPVDRIFMLKNTGRTLVRGSSVAVGLQSAASTAEGSRLTHPTPYRHEACAHICSVLQTYLRQVYTHAVKTRRLGTRPGGMLGFFRNFLACVISMRIMLLPYP